MGPRRFPNRESILLFRNGPRKVNPVVTPAPCFVPPQHVGPPRAPKNVSKSSLRNVPPPPPSIPGLKKMSPFFCVFFCPFCFLLSPLASLFFLFFSRSFLNQIWCVPENPRSTDSAWRVCFVPPGRIVFSRFLSAPYPHVYTKPIRLKNVR